METNMNTLTSRLLDAAVVVVALCGAGSATAQPYRTKCRRLHGKVAAAQCAG
jgi:hypothetical protein